MYINVKLNLESDQTTTLIAHPAGKSRDLSEVQLMQVLQTYLSASELSGGVSALPNSKQSVGFNYCCSVSLENCELASASQFVHPL